MSSKESLVNVQLLKRVEEAANNYEIESDGIRCCLPVKVNKKTSTLLLTVGFFVYIENNTVIAYPWSQLESRSRNKDTHGTDFVFKTKSETADLHVTSIPKKIIDKFFATVKEIAVGLSPKIPKFNPSDGLKFSSRPDVLLSVLLGRNNPYLNQISSYFCNRPKIFNISYFISNPNIVKKIFKVVDLTE